MSEGCKIAKVNLGIRGAAQRLEFMEVIIDGCGTAHGDALSHTLGMNVKDSCVHAV